MLRNFSVFIFLLVSSIVLADCPDIEGDKPGLQNLTVSATTLDVVQEQFDRNVTTLGIIKNAAPNCFRSLVLEIKYFDADNKNIDTVNESIYGLVVPASGEVSFRALNKASKPKDAYVSQQIRILNAEAFPENYFPSTKNSDSFWPMISGWLIWLPFIIIIVFSIYSAKSKDSPQQRQLAIKERQVLAHELQNIELKRIADSLELLSKKTVE